MTKIARPERKPKKIVILLDGTSNEIKEDRTNILRLYGTLTKSETQLVYYDPGVGTLGAKESWSKLARHGNEIWGMATGHGLDKNVKEAYRFLVENFDKDAGDQIYIFGYSRGAYTARVLAGFLHGFGLIEKRNLNLLDYVYRAYTRVGENGDEQAFAEIGLHYKVLRPKLVPIRCLGLFDTVASLIERVGFKPRLKKHAFTVTNGSVESVRHAVALGEKRVMFRPQLWGAGQNYTINRFAKGPHQPQDAKEVWFAGSHADVGGGLPEEQSALAKVPLEWMIEETKALGLEYTTRTVNELVLGQNKAKQYVEPNKHATAYDSMTRLWSWIDKLATGRREVPEGGVLHHSVLERTDKPEHLPLQFKVLQENGAVVDAGR